MTALTTALDVNNAAPGVGCFAITPSDVTNFSSGVIRAVYVGGTGNVAIVNIDDTVVTWIGCPVGLYIMTCCKRVNSTDTTATNLIGIL